MKVKILALPKNQITENVDENYIKENEKHFRYLFDLQMSGRTNMFGAGQYLQSEQGLDRIKAREILTYWMQNYDEIAKKLGIEVMENMNEVAPPGWEGTVKAMKKHSVGGAKRWNPKKKDEGVEEAEKKKITNPYALAWWMKNKGYKSHKEEDDEGIAEATVDMKMGPSYKVVQPTLAKTSEPDQFARTNQYDPEVSESEEMDEAGGFAAQHSSYRTVPHGNLPQNGKQRWEHDIDEGSKPSKVAKTIQKGMKTKKTQKNPHLKFQPTKKTTSGVHKRKP